MTEDKRALLIENTVRNMQGTTDNLKYRHAVHCYKADPDYGERLINAFNLDMNYLKHLTTLSEKELQFETRSKV